MFFNVHHLHRLTALFMAIFGLYVFMSGVKTSEYKILNDGSLIDTSQGNLIRFKQSKAVLTFRAGFDIYRSISFGVSSFFLFLDLLLNSGYLTLPALVLASGEIVNDFSDFCLAVALIGVYIGLYPAFTYGVTYLALLVVEVLVWLGTCKFHQTCRLAHFEKKILKQKLLQLNRG